MDLIQRYERCLYYACTYSDKFGHHIPEIESSLSKLRRGEDLGSSEKVWPSYFIRNVLRYEDEIKYLDYWDENNIYIDGNGVVRWRSNNSVPPQDILDVWNKYGKPFNYNASIYAHECEVEDKIRSYVEANKDYKPTTEDMIEMRSVFGEGSTVVNILTGKKVIV